MRPSLFPSDDELPTWLHTSLCLGVVATPAAFLLWFGLGALARAHLDPLPGPEVGQYFFGPRVLTGGTARLAGLTLCLQGVAFLSLGWSFSRHAEGSVRWRVLPWLLLAVAFGLTWAVR